MFRSRAWKPPSCLQGSPDLRGQKGLRMGKHSVKCDKSNNWSTIILRVSVWHFPQQCAKITSQKELTGWKYREHCESHHGKLCSYCIALTFFLLSNSENVMAYCIINTIFFGLYLAVLFNIINLQIRPGLASRPSKGFFSLGMLPSLWGGLSRVRLWAGEPLSGTGRQHLFPRLNCPSHHVWGLSPHASLFASIFLCESKRPYHQFLHAATFQYPGLHPAQCVVSLCKQVQLKAS